MNYNKITDKYSFYLSKLRGNWKTNIAIFCRNKLYLKIRYKKSLKVSENAELQKKTHNKLYN